MPLNGLICAEVPLRHYSLTHSCLVSLLFFIARRYAQARSAILLHQFCPSVRLSNAGTVSKRLYNSVKFSPPPGMAITLVLPRYM